MRFNRIVTVFLVLFLFFYFSQSLSAQDSPSPVQVEIFSRPDCSHCQKLELFLQDLSQQPTPPNFKYTQYNIYDPNNLQLFQKFTSQNNLPQATPIILIGQTILQGFDRPSTTGQTIIDLIQSNQTTPRTTFQSHLSEANTNLYLSTSKIQTPTPNTTPPSYYLTIPLTNHHINVMQYSLPSMSFILGLIDGFNPCAMWVLISFVIILSQLGSRKKMILFSTIFILAETIMYYLILTLWFNTWNFIGLDNIITPVVGIIAIGGGLFFLYEYRNSDGQCKITNLKQRTQTTNKIKTLATQPLTFLTILGIITIAFSVNIVEFACSIGIPQAFTKILELKQLSPLINHLYITIYIFGYMLDDFLIFGLAIFSFEKIGLTTKYSKICQLIGGLIMITLGLIMIFKPQLLQNF